MRSLYIHVLRLEFTITIDTFLKSFDLECQNLRIVSCSCQVTPMKVESRLPTILPHGPDFAFVIVTPNIRCLISHLVAQNSSYFRAHIVVSSEDNFISF